MLGEDWYLLVPTVVVLRLTLADAKSDSIGKLNNSSLFKMLNSLIFLKQIETKTTIHN